MKKVLNVAIILFCLVMITPVFADIVVNEESQYGTEVEFVSFGDYDGDISIDGMYVHQSQNEYIFTVTYSNGQLAYVKNNGELRLKTSFFNPPDGDDIKLFWGGNYDRITVKDNVIQYRVDKEVFDKVDDITIFLFDEMMNDDDKNISLYFRQEDINVKDSPDASTLVEGYEIKLDAIAAELDSKPATWAKNSIEELQLEGIFRDEAFSNFSEGITRQRFIYLMVELYEQLMKEDIKIDTSISFDDSSDPHVLKAATIGITSGIGDNKFGPDIILNREQMTTFLIKTLNLAKVSIESDQEADLFNDDTDISEWAKSSVYTAKHNKIMSGSGDNMFAPKAQATNEQALFITHDLMKKYGSLRWAKAYDRERVYLRFEDELYQLIFDNDVIITEANGDYEISLLSFDDVNKMLNALLLKKKDLSFVEVTNPNIKGYLELKDYEQMVQTVKNLFLGVDKSGEKTIINFGSGKYIAEVVHKFDGHQYGYNNFEVVKYYDKNQVRQSFNSMPLDKLAEAYEINYQVTYNASWDIYVIEVVEKESE